MTTPLLARTREDLADLLAASRKEGRAVALVPTMGALHEGHSALMREARARVGDGQVVVSIFVNPLQFGAGEDLDRYPRALEADLERCASEGVDVVFAPSVDEVYPGGAPEVTLDPGPRAAILEGRTRPEHFRGVLIVVARLFGLVRPDLAVFGQKDYQQLVLVRQMVEDLCLPVEVVGAETVREPDGLALSSRNRYLGAEQRARAGALYRTLHAAANAASYGFDAAIGSARAELRSAHGVDLDYLEITSPELGAPPLQGEARILIAARVAGTRLIDNMAIVLGASLPPRGATTEGDS